MSSSAAKCICATGRDVPHRLCPVHGERAATGSRRRAGESSWVLVERHCERHPSDWRLVFKRGDEVLEVSVSEEVWRAFDR